MTYYEHPGLDAHTEHDKALFLVRVIFIIILDRIVIEEYGLGFFKRNAMFLLICFILPWVPFESNHTYTVFTLYVHVKNEIGMRGEVTVSRHKPAKLHEK